MTYKLLVLVHRIPADRIDAVLLADELMYPYQDKEWVEYSVEEALTVAPVDPEKVSACRALLSPFGWEEGPTAEKVDGLLARNPGKAVLVLVCRN